MPLFIQKNHIVSSKSKRQLVSIKSDRQTCRSLFLNIEKLFNLNSFFAHENHLYPIFISKNGHLWQCKTKLDLLACLYTVVEPLSKLPDVKVKLVDETGYVNMNLPRHSKYTGNIVVLILQREY